MLGWLRLERVLLCHHRGLKARLNLQFWQSLGIERRYRRQSQFECLEQVIREWDCYVEAVSQKDYASEVLDSGLNDADIDEVEKHRRDVSGHIGQFEGLNLLPVVAF